MTELLDNQRGSREMSGMRSDMLPYAYISGLQQRFRKKLFNPNTDDGATERLVALRESWANDGNLTVFTTGVFDMLHLDHSGYLLHAKATGAALLYERANPGKRWEDLNGSEQIAYTTHALGSRLLRLVVSVDGDQSVMERKGYKSDKGGTIRPVYSWETRALMVAGQSFVDPNDVHGEALIPVVDAVTIHGPQDFVPDNVHSSHLDLAGVIAPDVWTIFGESTDIIEQAPVHPGLGSVALTCIEAGEGTHYYTDRFIGKMTTTGIVNRLTGEA